MSGKIILKYTAEIDISGRKVEEYAEDRENKELKSLLQEYKNRVDTAVYNIKKRKRLKNEFSDLSLLVVDDEWQEVAFEIND